LSNSYGTDGYEDGGNDVDYAETEALKLFSISRST